MGGCNSTLNSLELAGAVIGAGIATAATGGVAAAGAIAGTAAAGTYFATKQGCSRSASALVHATNEIVATAIITSLTYCTQIAETWQDINITCNPVLPAGQVYEGNLACGQCVTDVFEGMLAQHALERKLWIDADPASIGVRLDINSEYTLLMGRVGTCGVVACKACTLANVSQSNILTAESSCYDTLTDTTQFKSNLGALVQQQLLNNQDVLAGVAKALGDNNVTNLTQTIVTSIATQVTETFLQNFVQLLKSTQILTLNTVGSFSGNGIAQINTYQVAVQYVSDQNVVTNALGSSVFDIIQQVAEQQNTLNDVGTLVFQSTIGFGQALDNVVGQVMVATLALLAVVVLGILGYAGYRFVRRSAAEAARVASEVELSSLQKAAFQQF